MRHIISLLVSNESGALARVSALFSTRGYNIESLSVAPTDDGSVSALRYNDWKILFMEQKSTGTFRVWMEPFVELRMPKVFNLRTDPYETSIDSGLYTRFFADQLWLFVPVQDEVGKWLSTFRAFPPRQPTASFSIDKMRP